MKKQNETQPSKPDSTTQIAAILANSRDGYGLDLFSPARVVKKSWPDLRD
jgi:hypothetical protein